MRTFLVSVSFAVLVMTGLAAPAKAQVVFYSDNYTPRTVYRTAPSTRYIDTLPTTRYVETVPTVRYVDYEPETYVRSRVVREVEPATTRTVLVRDYETSRYVVTVPETTRVVRSVPVEPTYVVRTRSVTRGGWRHR